MQVFMTKPHLKAVGLTIAALPFLGCSEPNEAPRVKLPVVIDGSQITPVTTNLGYDVELESVHVVVEDVVFTVAGEIHTKSFFEHISDAVIPPVFAHPGHYQGGEITGELPGIFNINWLENDGDELGTATLIEGNYSAANFTFGRGSKVQSNADLVGHTAVLTGRATKENHVVSFHITIDSPEGRELVGAPFEATINSQTKGTLGLRFSVEDPLEGDTLFDDVDFHDFDFDDDNSIIITPNREESEDVYNIIRRRFQTHDHFNVHLSE